VILVGPNLETLPTIGTGTAIVRGEMVDYLRERQQGEKAAAIESDDARQVDWTSRL
jgi:butyrate kinase